MVVVVVVHSRPRAPSAVCCAVCCVRVFLFPPAGARVPQRGVPGVLLGGGQRGGVREHALPEAHAGRSRPHEGLLPDTPALRRQVGGTDAHPERDNVSMVCFVFGVYVSWVSIYHVSRSYLCCSTSSTRKQDLTTLTRLGRVVCSAPPGVVSRR